MAPEAGTAGPSLKSRRRVYEKGAAQPTKESNLVRLVAADPL